VQRTALVKYHEYELRLVDGEGDWELREIHSQRKAGAGGGASSAGGGASSAGGGASSGAPLNEELPADEAAGVEEN
jgi:hypothetical protein